MSDMATEAARMMDMLPESDRNLAFELIKKLVLAWDPDFTKTTPAEAAQIAAAEAGEFIEDSEIDWNNLNKYAE